MSFLSTHMPSTSAPGDGSRTVIITDALPRPEDESSDNPDQTSTVGTIRLRGGPRRIRQHVAWEEDVVDNEGSGKKSSKICCIYHKPKRFDESSDEDSSDSDSDSSCDHNYPSHRHSHGHRNRTRAPRGDGGAAETRGNQGVGVVYQLEDNSESNAYEIIPASRKGKRKGV